MDARDRLPSCARGGHGRRAVRLASALSLVAGSVMGLGATALAGPPLSKVAPSRAAIPRSEVSRVVAGLVDVNVRVAVSGEGRGGSGIVISPTGDVLTNNHLIEGETIVRAKDLGNGRIYAASVLGYDIAADIAVLRLKGASRLRTAPTGGTSALKLGMPVTAIGSSLSGGSWSSTTGKVQGTGRSVLASDRETGVTQSLKGLIVASATAQAGYAGAALVGPAGQVVGVITAGSSNLAFAVPIGTALAVARMVESGRFSGDVHPGATAFLGAVIEALARSHRGGAKAGVRVVSVFAGSPARRAGVAAGDILTAVGGQAVKSVAGLSDILLSEQPGRKVRLDWLDRRGKAHSGTATLVNGPPA